MKAITRFVSARFVAGGAAAFAVAAFAAPAASAATRGAQAPSDFGADGAVFVLTDNLAGGVLTALGSVTVPDSAGGEGITGS